MARKKRRRIASRGSVNNIILKTLVNGDKYGYEIIKEVEDFSEGKIKLKQPSLYSSLSRFEDKNFVTSYWGDSDIGGRRHYYHLTEQGLDYYRRVILKEFDDIDDDVFTHEDLQLENDNDTSYTEISDDELPAIADFDTPEEETIIPDHNFTIHTPTENLSINNFIEEPNNDIENTDLESKIIHESRNVKNNSTNIITEESKIIEQPSQKIILDNDGIYKLRDKDFVPVYGERKEVIIDNVIKRQQPDDTLGYGYKAKEKTSPKEISEEEKRQRNEAFLNRFNKLSESRIKPVSPPTVIEEKKPEIKIDYRQKLNAIIEEQSVLSTDIEDDILEEKEENNLFNYVEEDNWNKSTDSELEDDDKFVDFDESEKFDIKTTDTQYITQINEHTSINSSQVKMTKYETKANAVLVDKTYLLINKLKLVFGIIMSVLMIVETSILLAILKSNNLVQPGDNTIFILAYIAIAIFALFYIIPYFYNPNNHKANNFKMKYSIWFGILTFLVCTILIYCINALAGFEIDNFQYFAVKLILPITLIFNFVIAPVIYGILVKNKSFYD